MSRGSQPSGCGTVLGMLIFVVVMAAIGPFILEILEFLLFMLIAFLVHLFSH
jgi:hypothetical protein